MPVIPAVGLKNYGENEARLGYIVRSCVKKKKKKRTKISNTCYARSKQTKYVIDEKPHL
jgi:hypothetical protein